MTTAAKGMTIYITRLAWVVDACDAAEIIKEGETAI